jgi:hypothetical protein
MLTNGWHGLDIAIEAVVSQSREELRASEAMYSAQINIEK